MQKTVKELMEMIYRDKLHANISTQRDFIYNGIKKDNEDGETTKAGDVIKSILERNIQLPALYFWNVQDDKENVHYAEDEFNVHDGKQRMYSIMYFVRPIGGNEVSVRLNGLETKFKDLPIAQKEKILNYTFDIVVRKGTLKEEEISFLYINSSGEPLTNYEALRGAYHGDFITEFENYINNLSSSYDHIQSVERGRQAQYFLYMCLDDLIYKDRHKMFKLAQDKLDIIRNNHFNPEQFNLEKKLKLYNRLASMNVILTNGSLKDPEKLCRIASYIVDRGYDIPTVTSYYYEGSQNINDIGKWKFEEEHKIAIDGLFNGVKCDFRRNFTTEEKIHLIESEGYTCQKCKKKLSFGEIEVDHIIPWSKGGKTVLSNAQVLCKSCNSSKGDKK